MSEETKNEKLEMKIEDMDYDTLLGNVLKKIVKVPGIVLYRLDGFLDGLEMAGVNGKAGNNNR